MKFLILTLLTATLTSCAHKYENYHIIDKMNFNKDNYQAPIAKKMLPGKKVKRSFCSGQVFFASNAKKDTDRYVTNVMRSLCPDSQFLLNSKITETWWTTIIYSRSCVELRGHCPLKLKKPSL